MTIVKKNVLNTLVNVALPQGATEGGLDQEFPTFCIPFLTWSWKGAWMTTGLFLSFLLGKTIHLANVCSWSSFSCNKNIKTSIMKYFRIHFAIHGAITWICILLCFNMTGKKFELKSNNWLALESRPSHSYRLSQHPILFTLYLSPTSGCKHFGPGATKDTDKPSCLGAGKMASHFCQFRMSLVYFSSKEQLPPS